MPEFLGGIANGAAPADRTSASLQQAVTETAERTDGENLRAPVRYRRHETRPSTRPSEHPKTTAGARSRVQSITDPAEDHRSGEAPAVTGALFPAFYALRTRICAARQDSGLPNSAEGNFMAQSSRIRHLNSAGPKLRRRLRKLTTTTGC